VQFLWYELRGYFNSVQSPMQPAPMIYMYEVNLDLAVTAILKQISTQRRGDACVQKCVEKKQSRTVQRATSSVATLTQFSHLCSRHLMTRVRQVYSPACKYS
jgi:hypothetical protein